MYDSSWALYRGFSATATAPRSAHAYCANSHDGREGSQSATLSPRPMPSAASAAAVRRAWRQNSA
jgi:hypothetical protein